MAEHGIPQERVERAVAAPDWRAQDPCDEAVERFFLRVAVNTDAEPWRAVSAFFDRSDRGNA